MGVKDGSPKDGTAALGLSRALLASSRDTAFVGIGQSEYLPASPGGRAGVREGRLAGWQAAPDERRGPGDARGRVVRTGPESAAHRVHRACVSRGLRRSASKGHAGRQRHSRVRGDRPAGHAALARDAGSAVARSGGADRRPAGRDTRRHGTPPRQSGAARQRAPVSHALQRRSRRHLPDGSLRIDDVRQPAFLGGDGACRGGGGPEGLARCGPSGGRRARAGGMVPGFRPSAGLRRRAPVPSLRRDRTVGACLRQSGTRPRRQLQWLHRHDHRHHREAAGRARDRVAEPRAGDDCEGISSRRNADHAAAFRRGTGAGHAVVDPAARCRRDPPATWRRTEPASGLREGSRRCANRRARGAPAVPRPISAAL